MRRFLVLLLVVVPLGLSAREAPSAVDGALTVNVFQAKRLHELGALFVDVRAGREWSWGHVEGAVHFDLADEFGTLASRQWSRELPLVLYCDSAICPHSAQAARMAVAWGYRQVFYFRDGYFAWQLHDFPQQTAEGARDGELSARAH